MREEQNPLIEFLGHKYRRDTDAVDRPELEAEVEELLSRLTPAQRRVVEVRGFSGVSLNETSKILGISPETTYQAWYRAMEKLTGVTHPSLVKRRAKAAARFKPRTDAQKLRRNELERARYRKKNPIGDGREDGE